MVEQVPTVGDNAQGELKALAKKIQNSLKKSTLEKIKVGNWLNQARQLLASDNDFGDWCKGNFPGLNRHTRQNYMNLARTFGGELFNTINLMSDTALYLLARPGTPQNVQKYFIQRAQKGEIVKVKDIQAAKVRLSEVKDCDEELFELMKSQDFGSFNTEALDGYRGGTQKERIRSAENGVCVVAYPFDRDLIAWAEKSDRLIFAPNHNVDEGTQKPFYNFWLYRNNQPSRRMIFDNYWRHYLPPSDALQRYKAALTEETNEIRNYQGNLGGYVLFSDKVDKYWHAPSLAQVVNSLIDDKAKIERYDAPFWMSETWVPEGVGVDALAEQLRISLETRADSEEISRFIRLHSAMTKILPMLRSYLY